MLTRYSAATVQVARLASDSVAQLVNYDGPGPGRGQAGPHENPGHHRAQVPDAAVDAAVYVGYAARGLDVGHDVDRDGQAHRAWAQDHRNAGFGPGPGPVRGQPGRGRVWRYDLDQA